MKNIFYNASFPRSGSTLLQNILAQNPDIHATPTNGLADLIQAGKEVLNTSDFHAQDEDTIKQAYINFCRGGMSAFFNDITDKKYILDKGFKWSIELPFLQLLNGEPPKMIIVVRDLREVFASMEEGYRKKSYKTFSNVNWDTLEYTTLSKRIALYANSSPLGPSIDAFMEIVNWKLDKHVCFIKFEDLCRFPDPIIRTVYDYLEIPFYQHDFNNVEQVTDHNDNLYLFSHKVRKEVKPIEPKAKHILGEDACNWIYKEYEWFFKYFNYAL